MNPFHFFVLMHSIEFYHCIFMKCFLSICGADVMQPADVGPAPAQTAALQGEDEFNRTSLSQVTHASAMSVAVRIQTHSVLLFTRH